MKEAGKRNDELALSQLSLRKGLGLLGIALPLVLLIAAIPADVSLQRSLSAYYYQPHLRDLFVGILWAIGAFLVFYRGYSTVPSAFQKLPAWISRHMTDGNLTTLAGLGALATAMLPTCENPDICSGDVVAGLHLAASVTFLGTLAILSIWAFTESDQPRGSRDAGKHRRNWIYAICGWVILAALAIAGYVIASDAKSLGPFTKPVFWLESVAIWAFGISWLVKGEAIQAMAKLLRRNEARKA